uniref:NADH-ubiquinone oxidoreductase chain 2 n=1 Tax=Helopeltis sp. TaxID=2931293 RepID=A0A8T9ZYR9_9HEMI|nr:NADH dehydrogenase subunit 2 [Helopeltis sp.]
MFKMSSKYMFLMIMFMSTIYVMSSNNMFSMWMGMEMNMMAFMPLMFMKKNSYTSQSMLTYFLIQSMASMLFLMIILMYNKMYMYYMYMLMMLSMLMKLGMPPFHMWMPNVMMNLSWNMCFILMTWQKMAPMSIISLILMKTKFTMIIIMTSTIMGSIMGLIHTSIKKIMTYSSISHLSWMMATELMFKKSWIMYMMMYMMIMFMMINLLKKNNIMYINQMFFSNISTPEKINITLMMLSMGGLPPMLGFLPKWMTINYMISSNEMFMTLIMIMCALVTMIYYLKMISTSYLMMTTSQKWYMNMYKSKKNMYLLYMNLMLPLLIMLINMY